MPGYRHAVVDINKVTGYLLSETHPNGKHKARFFTRVGFSPSRAEVLQESLIKHARHDYIKQDLSGFGSRYVVEAPLESPDGRNPAVRSVWFIEEGGDIPRFVTAYPV